MLIPLLFVLAYAFFQRGNYGEIIYTFTFENIERIFESLYVGILIKTLIISAITTLICLFIAYPFAYYITKLEKRKQNLMLLLVTIPFWINFLVRSYAWIIILRSQGLLNTFLINIGLINEPLNLLYNTPSVILGMVYALLPFMVLPVYVSIEQLDKRKLEAAYDLGATPFRTFTNITLPLTMQGIITGSILVFVSSLGMFVVSDVMGGSKVALYGNIIQSQFQTTRDWPFGSALSIFIILLSIVLIYLYYKATVTFNYEKKGGDES